jgi:hypothetical protein
MNGSSIHEFSKDQKEKTGEDDNVVLLGDGTLSDSGHYAQRGLANSCIEKLFFTNLDPENPPQRAGQRTHRGVWTGNFTRETRPPDGKWQALRARQGI